MSQPPDNKAPTRRVSVSTRRPVSTSGRSSNPPPRSPRRSTNVNYPPPRRDPFPYVMGGIIGAMVIGLLIVVYLIASGNNNSGTPTQATTGGTDNSQTGGNAAGLTPPAANGPSQTSAAATQAADAPPRMPIDQFKALYDDPAKRPLIIDVRAKDIYDQGHIKGSESFPEADVDTRVNELPKDKLIVAYCQ